EDAPKDSFAGQFETFLNVKGKEKLLEAIKKCLASSFGDRVIAYREEKKISHLNFALSIGVQKMARSDLASSGIIFTLDTESGFKDIVLINSIWGVGEMIVKGKITPDQFYVFKPTLKQGYRPIIVKNLGRKNKKYIFAKNGGLEEADVSPKNQLKFSLSDEDILTLAKWAVLIEEHYGKPQDIEWAKDGKTGKLFIVQSRPETVYAVQNKKTATYQEYQIKTKKSPVITGIAIGNKIGIGKIRLISDVSKISQFQKGEVLLTKMTDPDWVPVMRLASAIITDEGGKACHAAIVARELGVPCIVGVRVATKLFKTGETVTVDCTQGSIGRIYQGEIPFILKKYDLKKIPKLKTKIMVNIGAPDIAFKTSFLPNSGVGLARIEFILADKIRIHPLALYHYDSLKDRKTKSEIDRITSDFKDKKQYFIDKLAEGISQIAAAFYPKSVIVRLSDFKTNEYAALVGGKIFEPEESNPMLGWRGASRYYDEKFRPAFEMECKAIKKAREVFGLKNIWAMIPFCRTVEEGKTVLEEMRKNGLGKTRNGLKVIVMCEIPSNVVLVDQFSEIFDSYSVGSNDLTQLLLGVDRDNAKIAHIFDESNEAVKRTIAEFIKKAHQYGKKVSICGEAPASVPGFVEFLIKCGIDSISVNPDSVIKTILLADKVEKKLKK
ncbi:MAG: phosphoenolpyruvate synthase, partial [Parcubacteria group bacterium CG1_02_39_15]